MDDLISRQDAIETVRKAKNLYQAHRRLVQLPSAQPEQTDCEYCHEDSDGYVKPIEKNNHAFVRFGVSGWELSMRANGWHGSAKIRFCPMCGRNLSIHSKGKWIWKGILFNAVILLTYWLLMRLFGFDALAAEFSEMGILLVAVMLLLGNATFFLLDRLLETRFK